MNELSWTMTAERERRHLYRMWALFGVIVCAAPLSFLFSRNEIRQMSISELLSQYVLVVSIVLFFLSAYIIFKLLTVPSTRQYTVSPLGLSIHIGEKVVRYVWSDFVFFSSNTERVLRGLEQSTHEGRIDPLGERREEAKEVASEIGEIYLRRARSPFGFGKAFLVLKVDGANTKEVLRILGERLPKQKMTNTTDLGLVWYSHK